VLGYKRDYESRFKSDVSTFGGHAYDGLMIAVEALKKAGTADKAVVRDAIETVRAFMGTAGVFNYSATDHVGLDVSGFRMLEIRKGDWTLAR
jgi:branched-chain amino acid transport system substrate-binding protein